MLCARGAEIYGQAEPGVCLYEVISGAVRSYRVLMDGRRQICDFHLRGDFFGLEADETHCFRPKPSRIRRSCLSSVVLSWRWSNATDT